MSNVYAKIFWLSLLLAKSHLISAATYERDIRPLLTKHCVECHREGESGPFPLDSFEYASRYAKLMAELTAIRFMPPYKATPLSLPFHNERRLTKNEISLLAIWAKQGAPRGIQTGSTVHLLPVAPPSFDQSWSMTEPVELPPSGKDVYRCFVIPTGLESNRWIDAFRFLPGNAKVVHHALFFFDTSRAARGLDREDAPSGYPCFGSPGFLPASSLGGWSPGNRWLEMPAGTAIRAPANSDLVMQIHYRLSGKRETDLSRLEVRYRASPPPRRLLDIALSSNQIDIPAGVANYIIRDRFEVPVPVTLQQIIPHAHFLAQRMRAWATLPGRTRRVLLAIDDWDFAWQDVYRLRDPLALPPGTILEMEIRYDNTTRNARNPNHPPQRVTWGFGTNDEMAGMHFNVTVDDEARDLSELNSHLWGKMVRTLGIGASQSPPGREPRVAPLEPPR
jgi:hypothetical protein